MHFTKDQIKALVGVYACALTFMGMLAPATIIADVAQAFPDVNIVLVQMLVSGTPLVAAFSGMAVASFLAHRVYKKTTALVSMAIMCVSGLAVLVFHGSIYQMLACTFFFGLGFGGAQNSSDALLADYFTGKERSFAYGFFGVAVGLGGIIWPLMAGMCAASGWANAYLSNLFIVPMFIISAIFLPKGKLEPKRKANVFANLPKEVVVAALYMMFYIIAMQLFSTNCSLIVAERGFGDVGAASVATLGFTCAGVIGGALVSPMFSAFKNQAMPICVSITAIGLVLSLFATSLAMLAIAGFIIGVGQQAMIPLNGNFAAANSNQAGRAFNLSFVQAGNSIGQLLSPILFAAVAAPMGGTVDVKLEIGIVLAIAVAIVGFVIYRKLTPMQIEEAKHLTAAQDGEAEVVGE